MVTSSLFQAAGACLAMSPLVFCGGNGGGTNGVGGSSAWVVTPTPFSPSSHTGLQHPRQQRQQHHLSMNGKRFNTMASRTVASPRYRDGLGSGRRRSDEKSPRSVGVSWWVWSALSARDARQRRRSSLALSSHPSWSVGQWEAAEGAAGSSSRREAHARFRNSRGKCGGFQLGSVAAVRSPGTGDGMSLSNDQIGSGRSGGGELEMREAFEGAKGEDGLMGLDGFRAFADVRELLENSLLKETEVVEIWRGVSKADAAGERVDFAGFCDAFTKVDALFEEEEEEEGQQREELQDKGLRVDTGKVDKSGEQGGDQVVKGVDASAQNGLAVLAQGAEGTAGTFVELVGSADGVLSLEELLGWREVTELLEENLLTRQEVENIWEGLPQVQGGIDLQGFLNFDSQLSDLFEDEEAHAGKVKVQNTSTTSPLSPPPPPPPTTTAATTTTTATKTLQEGVPITEEKEASAEGEGAGVVEGDEKRTLESQFAALVSSAGSGSLLSLDDLARWSEVSDLLEEELLSRKELDEMWQALPKEGGGISIDLAGFVVFAHKLDQMFETVEDNSSASSDTATAASSITTERETAEIDDLSNSAVVGETKSLQMPSAPASTVTEEGVEGGAAAAKARLLDLAEAEKADCGIGCGDNKRSKLMKAMEALVSLEEGNLALGDDRSDELISQLVGEWRLLYTSSNSMEFNQGLTGLANTIPNARFAGLRQIFHVDGMIFDAEYEEELAVGKDSEPLIITVTSDWEVKQTSSLITGDSTLAVAVAPKQIKYGFITVRAERWKTLRAMMLLDIAYLDGDIRIMRGQTARQNFFVFKKI